MDKLLREQVESINMYICRTDELYVRFAKKNGISYSLLIVLYAIDRKISCTQKQICDEWLIPKQTVSTVLKRLYVKGYVFIKTDNNDKREKILCFTKEGQAYADKFLSRLYYIEEKALSKLNKNLIEALIEGNKQYYEHLKSEVENE